MSTFGNFGHHSDSNYGIVDDDGSFPAAFPPVKSQMKYDLVDIQLLSTLSPFSWIVLLSFGLSRARLVQTYTVNASARTSYVFPLSPDGAICSFKAVINGTRVIEGVLQEEEYAKPEYETAISQGRFGALLQQHNVESTFQNQHSSNTKTKINCVSSYQFFDFP